MIKFGLKAIKKFDGTLCVVEWYEFSAPAREDRGAILTSDIVDDGIRATHKAEYAKFKAFVDANDSELFEKAKEAYPDPFFEIFPKPKPIIELENALTEEFEAVELEEKPVKPRSRKQKEEK